MARAKKFHDILLYSISMIIVLIIIVGKMKSENLFGVSLLSTTGFELHRAHKVENYGIIDVIQLTPIHSISIHQGASLWPGVRASGLMFIVLPECLPD
jgi:hypothetical protein